MPAAVLTMQEALLALTRYWAEQGCLVAQPMNTEVGAGTLNPATSLRVLGPERWRVAYVEPSVRPDDSRYGENPNRIQTHTQFQVILKPEPGDAQELYLGSLRALGIDIGAHDVRFVEDNWASPALGAWGLGWEVWLDGLEITQFTYFQQAGGVTLDPVSVELTYGMERILMALQGVEHFTDIAYAPGFSYGEVFGQSEYEMSRYYLDDADVVTNRTLLEAYEAEARRMVDARLPVPAHSYVLKCSHAFNVLDARGAISPTERARVFARMRGLSHQVAELWIARREEEGHPLGVVEAPTAPPVPETLPEITEPSTLAFEIGVEEMPPGEVTRAAEAVRAALTGTLAATRLAHGAIEVYASPRRVTALVEEVRPREDDDERRMRGPRASAAYDSGGAPTKAALGFARSQGVDVGRLERLDVGGTDYVGVTRRVPGRPAAEVLAAVLPEVVSGLRADKNMRWRAPGLSFTRPIRWVVALLGDAVVPFTVSSMASGRTTRMGHTDIDVNHASGYLDMLARSGVTVDPDRRRRVIETEAQALAADVGGHIDVSAEEGLLDEVTNLVEQPTVLLGGFDERYLDLPAEVLITVMRKHQRYLPVRDAESRLLPYFVAVADGECDRELVRAGNEAVLRARYEDASFFWRADLQVKPDDMKAGLAGLIFEERLGSMADRSVRIAAVAEQLARSVDLTGDEHVVLARAGQLAKFDLASQMVTELPTLAGVMAREYARQAGEPEPVARALFEMELPRQAGDALPDSAPGALLALADRLDLLAGLFTLGAAPTGSSDPFGLRRAALGVVAILRANPRLAAVTVPAALSAAGQSQPVEWTDMARDELQDFVTRRYEQQLLDADHDHKLVRAVLPLASTPARAEATLTELQRRVDDPDFAGLVETMQRVRRILPPGTATTYDPRRLHEPAEAALHDAVTGVRAELGDDSGDLARFTNAAMQLVKPVDDFFTDVLVNVDDAEVRANRLGLLAAIRDLSADVLDWRALD